ncbi:MAG: PqqD family peptide modification chaperone [Candidatus Thermoplasmatota archaeon]|nr:PqqD family peptide modification chaperone [Candidatus Thermoplasmatota archaeon]
MYPTLEKNIELRFQPTEAEVINRGKLNFTAVNDVGAEILASCDGKTPIDEICRRMAQRHDDTVRRVKPIILRFLEKAEKRGHVSFHDISQDHCGTISGSRKYFTPIQASVELTMACNLKCRHCYANSGTSKSNELSTEEFLDIFSKLYKVGVVRVTLTGGEPLLHNDLPEILEFCFKKFHLQLLTNGIGVTEKIARQLSRYIVTTQLSLDGDNSKTHDYMRGKKGVFEKTIKAIKILVRHRVPTVVAMSVTPFNIDQIEGCLHLALDLGVAGFRVGGLTPTGRAKDLGWELNEEEYNGVRKTRRKLANKYKDQIWVESEESLITGEERTEKSNDRRKITVETKDKPRKIKPRNCGAGYRMLVISPTGEVRPCPIISDERLVIGNIKNEGIKNILNHRIAKTLPEVIAPIKEICGECKYFYRCEGCIGTGLVQCTEIEDCNWAKKELRKLPKVQGKF